MRHHVERSVARRGSAPCSTKCALDALRVLDAALRPRRRRLPAIAVGDRAVHAPPGEVVRRRVELVDAQLDRSGAASRCAMASSSAVDARASIVLALARRAADRRRPSSAFFGREHDARASTRASASAPRARGPPRRGRARRAASARPARRRARSSASPRPVCSMPVVSSLALDARAGRRRRRGRSPRGAPCPRASAGCP